MKEIKRVKTKNNFFRGSLMMEAMIAIFICGGIFITFFAVMAQMYRSEFQQRDYIRAANLAQEGVEIVRNLRDNNLKKTYGSPAKPCTAFQRGVCDFPADGNCPSCNDPASLSGFTRTINIGPGTESKLIKSTVTWTPKGSSVKQRIEVTDTLWAWGDSE